MLTSNYGFYIGLSCGAAVAVLLGNVVLVVLKQQRIKKRLKGVME